MMIKKTSNFSNKNAAVWNDTMKEKQVFQSQLKRRLMILFRFVNIVIISGGNSSGVDDLIAHL